MTLNTSGWWVGWGERSKDRAADVEEATGEGGLRSRWRVSCDLLCCSHITPTFCIIPAEFYLNWIQTLPLVLGIAPYSKGGDMVGMCVLTRCLALA